MIELREYPNAVKERNFTSQSERFINMLLSMYGLGSLDEFVDMTKRPAVPITPILIKDYRNLTGEERLELRRQFNSEFGVASFIVLNPDAKPFGTHPLLDICHQLADDLHLHFPIKHPLEEYPDALERFGPSDGTVKIYSLPGKGGALTADSFALHQDGLGNCGNVESVGLYVDAPPLYGGYTYFLNVCLLSLHLARSDREAFNALFLHDAMTIHRSRGSRALMLKSPVLFINSQGMPQAFFRVADAEYIVTTRPNCSPLDRAMKFLLRFCEPFAQGTSFVHLTARGQGCFNQNQLTAHGRTSFGHSPAASRDRVLARKWFATSAEHTVYKHAPGMSILPEYAALYPSQFGPELLEGEWVYDPATDRNIRVR